MVTFDTMNRVKPIDTYRMEPYGGGSVLLSVLRFYRDGFRSMTVGRTLWVIIIVKLAVIFIVLRLIFFPAVLGGMSDEERAATVMGNMTECYDNLKHL